MSRIHTGALIKQIIFPEGDGCWEWRGRKSLTGGRFGAGGYALYNSRVATHSVWRVYIGELEPGLQLDHLCENTGCVNPAHLEPVTPQENTLRHRSQQTHCKHGHEFDEANTRLNSRPDRPGPRRVCRACERETQRRVQERKKKAA